MKSLGIYYRVSTDRQELASQESAIRDFIHNLDDRKKPHTIRIYRDHGLSGKNDNRPDYQRLLNDAFSKEIDTILVYKLDRFSRNANQAIKTIVELDMAGVAFISATQPVLNLGHDNPFRRTMLSAFAEIAEIERETISARVKSGLRAAKERGVILGAKKVYGNQDILTARGLRERGATYKQIARQMNVGLGTAYRLVN